MTDQQAYSLEVAAPVFPVTDIERSRAYYTGRLAFDVAFEWADSDDEPLNYLILQGGNTELHLSLAQAGFRTPNGGSWICASWSRPVVSTASSRGIASFT